MEPKSIILIAIFTILLIVFLLFLYSLCFTSGNGTDKEDQIYLAEWRKSITTETLVKYNGVVYHVLESGNGKAVISNHNDEFPVNVSDLWSVE